MNQSTQFFDDELFAKLRRTVFMPSMVNDAFAGEYLSVFKGRDGV